MGNEQKGKPRLPQWAAGLIELYESGAANQFVLYGNVNDRFLLPLSEKTELGSLRDFLLRVLLPRFEVVISYDMGSGIRLEKGQAKFAEWPEASQGEPPPKAPRQAIEYLTQYFRYAANLHMLKAQPSHIACVLSGAQLILPAMPWGSSYDLSATAVLVRDWSSEQVLTEYPLATFLLTENLTDLHGLLAANPRAALIKIPLPDAEELQEGLTVLQPRFPTAIKAFNGKLESLAAALGGSSLGSIESLCKTREYRKVPIEPNDLVQIKKDIVERDSGGLIEFVESKKTLDDIHGQEAVKAWFRQDIALWKQNDLQAMPMGYLLCGPVGTGKTFLVECLAGEAGVPVVKLKNFRDKWVGGSEGNLERIFRLLHALGRCFVFVDEADQALGKRDSGGGDSGVSGRLYSMLAEEMSRGDNRGKIVWVLASSRPDLIEVDLKRPGRVDVKIPLFPSATPEEGFALIKALCKRRALELPADAFSQLKDRIPQLLTPGAAEALAVKVYRATRTSGCPALDALKASLKDYQNPVARDVMDFQIKLAAREASDVAFVPAVFRAEAAA